MKTITSAENKNVLKAASLKEKKYRDLYGLYLIEGKRAVSDALSCGAKIESVFVCGGENASAVAGIGESAEIFSVTESIMKKICGTLNPQNISAAVKIRPAELKAPKGNALVLDRISDPGNLGTIIRSAAACGIKDIFLIGGADLYNPKVIRATMGGINYINAASGTEREILSVLNDTEIICADMGGKNIFDYRLNKGSYALVIGNEAEGVSKNLIKACSCTVSLPMENVESLNAAVCASVMMYTLKFMS